MRLLVIRFSAIGDVAMAVPVIKSLALAYPELKISVASRPFARAFFEGLAENVEFIPFDLKNKRYKGFLGLEHLYKDLSALKPDMVADLHDVLRTKYARKRFRMNGIPTVSIDKYRKGRKLLTRQENKILEQQPTSFEKYQAVFSRLGFEFPLIEGAPLCPSLPEDNAEVQKVRQQQAVGIAPFAAHDGKIYPIDKTEHIIHQLLNAHPDLHIYLFGGGPKEKDVFDVWCRQYDRVAFASGMCKSMKEEIAMMRYMKCVVSMDSGNMHLASLVGTPVVSIWGATHPLAGFMGWHQSADDVVQVDLPCRPCSIYGNKPCMRGDYACLHNIPTAAVIEKIERYLF